MSIESVLVNNMSNNPIFFDNLSKATNDIIYTNPILAKRIVDYFKPTGFCIEPCAGNDAIYQYLPDPKDWCEIARNKDFLTYQPPQKIDWVITNFPWSGKIMRPLARRAYELSDNVVQIIRLSNMLGDKNRIKDYTKYNHALKEIIVIDWKGAFINKKPEGFTLIVAHTQKEYAGDMKWNYW